MNRKCLVKILTIGLLLSAASVAFAQTAAFTYQGRLNDGGNPANGNYDMQFRLFDNQNVGQGAQQGGTITNPSVAVSNGAFAVSLDFGAAVFGSGADRFLEISVRPSGSSGAYTPLAPRQKLTSSPYSVRSNSSNSADGLSGTCIGCVQSSQINSLDGNKVTGAVANSTTANNASNLGGLPVQRFVKFELDGTVSIGTTGTGSTLTVGGMIESTSGGIKFPDGSQQTSAGLATVTTNGTLTGDGTSMAPLGISSPLMVRDIDNPAFQPFAAYTQVPGTTILVIVPSGKRLVIDYVNALVRVSSGVPFIQLAVSFVQPGRSYVMAQTSTSTSDSVTYYFYDKNVRIYLSAGNRLALTITGGTDLGVTSVVVSGYYVDDPLPLTNSGGTTNVQKK